MRARARERRTSPLQAPPPERPLRRPSRLARGRRRWRRRARREAGDAGAEEHARGRRRWRRRARPPDHGCTEDHLVRGLTGHTRAFEACTAGWSCSSAPASPASCPVCVHAGSGRRGPSREGRGALRLPLLRRVAPHWTRPCAKPVRGTECGRDGGGRGSELARAPPVQWVAARSVLLRHVPPGGTSGSP